MEALESCGDIDTYRQVYVLASQYASETARELQAALAANIGTEKANDFMKSVNEAITMDIA